MKQQLKKKLQTVDFRKPDSEDKIIDRDINLLIKELKEQDKLEETLRQQRIEKIFKEVLMDGK
jgi:hypothetical protein